MIYIAYQVKWIFVIHAEGLIGTGEVHCLNQSQIVIHGSTQIRYVELHS